MNLNKYVAHAISENEELVKHLQCIAMEEYTLEELASEKLLDIKPTLKKDLSTYIFNVMPEVALDKVDLKLVGNIVLGRKIEMHDVGPEEIVKINTLIDRILAQALARAGEISDRKSELTLVEEIIMGIRNEN